MKTFSIYDSKTEAFIIPWYAPTTASGIRSFETAVKDPSTQFNQHPGDYTLFEIGEFDETLGIITMHRTPTNLGLAITYLKEV